MTAYSSITNVGAQALAASPSKAISLTRCVANTDTYLSLAVLQGVTAIPSTGAVGTISSTKAIPSSSSMQVNMSFANTGDAAIEASTLYLCARIDGGEEIPFAIYYNSDDTIHIPGSGEAQQRVTVATYVTVSNDEQVTIEYSESEVQPSDLDRYVSRVKANGGVPDPEDIFGTKRFRGQVSIEYPMHHQNPAIMRWINTGVNITQLISGGPVGEDGTETVTWRKDYVNFEHLRCGNSPVLTQANLWDHCIPDNYSVGLQGTLSSSVPVTFRRQDEIYTGKQITVGGTTYTLSIYNVDGEVADHLYVTSKVSHTFNDGASSYASVPCVKAW